ncbi:MAG: FAD binding domain-containing protein [Deltaproteobacteria bacterium]|nr:FAD binding domain-containing protein [Deltaproteobacteria bacterium]
MRLDGFSYVQPKTSAEACEALAAHGPEVKVLAGGTDLLIRMKHGVTIPKVLVSLRQAEGLTRIRAVGDSLGIGASVTLTDVRRSDAVRVSYPLLAEAALAVGAAQLQNMGTLGGNLCLEPRCWYFQQTPSWREARAPCFKNGGGLCYMAKGAKRCYALYCGDTAPALLALGASVRLVRKGGERLIPLEEFFVDDGQKHTVLQQGELVTEVVLPAPTQGQKGTYLKYRKRGAVDFPVVGVAAVVRNGEARVAITGAGSAPFLVAGPSRCSTSDDVERIAKVAWRQARPASRMEVSPSYRKLLVRILTKDALEEITRQA